MQVTSFVIVQSGGNSGISATQLKIGIELYAINGTGFTPDTVINVLYDARHLVINNSSPDTRNWHADNIGDYQTVVVYPTIDSLGKYMTFYLPAIPFAVKSYVSVQIVVSNANGSVGVVSGIPLAAPTISSIYDTNVNSGSYTTLFGTNLHLLYSTSLGVDLFGHINSLGTELAFPAPKVAVTTVTGSWYNSKNYGWIDRPYFNGNPDGGFSYNIIGSGSVSGTVSYTLKAPVITSYPSTGSPGTIASITGYNLINPTVSVNGVQAIVIYSDVTSGQNFTTQFIVPITINRTPAPILITTSAGFTFSAGNFTYVSNGYTKKITYLPALLAETPFQLHMYWSYSGTNSYTEIASGGFVDVDQDSLIDIKLVATNNTGQTMHGDLYISYHDTYDFLIAYAGDQVFNNGETATFICDNIIGGIISSRYITDFQVSASFQPND